MGGTSIEFPTVMSRLAVCCLVLAAFTSTWGGLKPILKVQPGDVFLLLTLSLIVALVIFGDLRFSTPIWMWIAPVAVILCVAIRWFDPVPYALINMPDVSSLSMVRNLQEMPYAPDNIPKAAAWVFALVFVPVAIIGCTKLDPRTPQFVMAAFTAGVCVSSVVALSDLMGLTRIGPSLELANDSGATRQSGLSTHVVMLGFICIIAIPFALYFLSVARRKWIPATAFLILLGGVLASGSRGAQAAVPLVCILAVLVAPNKKAALRQALVTVGVSGVVVAVFAHAYLGDVIKQLVRFGVAQDAGKSNVGRGALARQAIEDFQNFPIAGVGIKYIVNAHNIYLQLLSSGGLILAVAMLVYWIWVMRDSWTLARRGILEARYLLVSVVAWLVLGGVENQITDRLLYYSIGCVAALSSLYLSTTSADEEPAVSDAMARSTT